MWKSFTYTDIDVQLKRNTQWPSLEVRSTTSNRTTTYILQTKQVQIRCLCLNRLHIFYKQNRYKSGAHVWIGYIYFTNKTGTNPVLMFESVTYVLQTKQVQIRCLCLNQLHIFYKQNRYKSGAYVWIGYIYFTNKTGTNPVLMFESVTYILQTKQVQIRCLCLSKSVTYILQTKSCAYLWINPVAVYNDWICYMVESRPSFGFWTF